MSRVNAAAQRDFEAHGIAGTHNILMALNCPEPRRAGLLGFSIQREQLGPNGHGPHFIRSDKVFQSIIPDPKSVMHPKDPTKAKILYTSDFPVQSFLWGDYTSEPDTAYRFTIMPRYGKPGALTTDPRDQIVLNIRTEKEFDHGHGVWFNRGAIASQRFAELFGNHAPKNENDPTDKEVIWLSRGLLEACLAYIRETPAGDGLRVAAYEFTYPSILNELKAAIDRGVDVKIVYHDTTKARKAGGNEKAMKAAKLPIDDQTITFKRSRTKIPHNKFIVRLQNGTTPSEVWTGSTNFTSSGFLGQTNVGHRIGDAATAQQYLDYWSLLKTDPTHAPAVAGTAQLTADPPEVLGKNSIARLFSPRAAAEMLGYYGRRMLDSANSMMFTAPFGVSPELQDPIAKARDAMRFVLLEKPTAAALTKKLTRDRLHVVLSYGSWLGKAYTVNKKTGVAKAKKGYPDNALDKWFLHEDHFRHQGNVFFVHTKFLLIDPLSDDPLVCSGSANFSSNSLINNDENMLLIRGDTRVADIYLTEFDRVFRHFYSRDVINELGRSKKGSDVKAAFLDETDAWTESYFMPGHIKTNRRLMFFMTPKTTWFANAALDKVPAPARHTPGKTGKQSQAARKTKPKPRRPKNGLTSAGQGST